LTDPSRRLTRRSIGGQIDPGKLSIDVAGVRGRFIRNLPRNHQGRSAGGETGDGHRYGWCGARRGTAVGERRGGKFQP
jgi:hypothetical protein